MKRNIILLYLFTFFQNFYMDLALLSIYLTDKKGFSIAFLGIFQAVLMLTKLLLEVPSGVLSDRFGRVKMLAFSTILVILSNISMIVGNSALVIIFSSIFFGIATSLVSGTLESLVYDSLLSIKEEYKYKRVNTNLYMITMISMSIAILLGGYLSVTNMDYMYIGNIIATIFAVFMTLFMIEPQVVIHNTQTIWCIIDDARSILKNNKKLILLIGFITISLSISRSVWIIGQKLFAIKGLTYMQISYESVFTCLAAGIAAKLGFYIERKLKLKYFSILIFSITVFPLILFSTTNNILLMFVMLTLITMTEGFTDPIYSDYINTEISSKSRATVLSIKNLIASIFNLVFATILGFMNNISETFLIIACAAIPIYIVIMYKLFKKY